VTRSKFFIVAFAVAVFGEIISLLGEYPSHFIFKPAIMLTLIGYYLSEAEVRNGTFLRALFFCWAGDCLLMFTHRSEWFFILGLIAFLIGHLYYIFTFRQIVWEQESQMLPTQKVRLLFPILLAGTGLMVVLYPVLGNMKVPVLFYSIVLMLMVAYALLRVGRTSRQSFTWVFVGALFFMISDSLLAINKFYSVFRFANLAVMGTYIIAQFMIVKGILVHSSKGD
jgi:uncharacterized membrane protein YhhN